MGWIRIGRDEWVQYVGRRVKKFCLDGERVYFAYAGYKFCGRHATLDEAKAACLA